MSNSDQAPAPKTQPLWSGDPPKPPKKTATGFHDEQPGNPQPKGFITKVVESLNNMPKRLNEQLREEKRKKQ